MVSVEQNKKRNMKRNMKTQLSNKSIEVKSPIQVLVGSFNHSTGKHRRFIPVPVKLVNANLDGLYEGMANVASDQHGNGVELPCSIPGVTRHAILVEGESKYLPFGTWIVEYDYSNDEGTHGHNLFLAAELA